MTKLYVVALGRFGADDISGVLITGNGEGIHQHVSSSIGWLVADLTSHFGRKAELEQRYPDGYEIVTIDLGDDLPSEIAAYFESPDPEPSHQ